MRVDAIPSRACRAFVLAMAVVLVACSATAPDDGPARVAAARLGNGAVGTNDVVPDGFAALIGRYRGTLAIHGRRPLEVAMGLDIEATADPSRYRWVIRYGSGADADVRDYLLLVDDAATGKCRIDEQNTIELHGRLRDGELVSVFAVAGQTLVTRYRLCDDGIEFALESFAASKAEETGRGVKTYPVFTSQRALLRRVD
ncbi:MAG: hypothetical protein NXI31_26570 [bacterium]|nr:hypothetical protein [bacterium]